MKRFALAGNPNCGKTTLFNSLTGSTAHVGNWPGVTVDKKEGMYKKCAEPISIVDLPGIYSLSPYTPEEVISRNYILDEKPDCVINIVDATNLERNLYLTTQIMEIDVPMIIALNMMDTVEKNGDKIDAKSLEEKIGLPVVEISALREKGLDELMQRAYEVCGQPRKGRTVLEGTQLTHLINDCRIALEGSGVENSLFHAVKLVELDEIEVGQHPQAAQMVEEFKKTFKDDVFGTDFEAIVADARYKYISKNYSSVVTKKEKNEKEKLSVSDKADKVLTHKVWGIPIFLVILFLVFHLTFAEDFLFLGAGGVFDKDVVAYLDASATQAVDFAQTPYDKDTTYYTEDGFKADLTFTDDGELEAVEAKPYVYTADHELRYVDELTEADLEQKFYADEKGKWEVTVEANDDGELEASFVSGIDEWCSGISAATFFGYEESVYGPGVILANILNTFTEFLSTCVNEGLAMAARPNGASDLSLTVSSAVCLQCSASCRKSSCCSCSSPFWKTAAIWRV